MPNKKPVMTTQVKLDIELHKISCLLCNALEGGSNYWYTIKEFIKPTIEPIVAYSSFGDEDPEIFPHLDYPLNEGGALIIVDNEDDEKEYRLDLEAIKKGIQIMSEKYPWHFSNFINETDDADTGDTFLQCCLFGEAIYG